MTADTVAKIIREDITKNHLIDVVEMVRANRKMGGDHAVSMGLKGKGAARIAGLSAYELNVERLAELTTAHGGHSLEFGCFPGTKLRNYKFLGQYGRVLLGFASIEGPGTLPSANITHRNGAKLNYRFSATPYLPGIEPTPMEDDVIYVIVLAARDREDLSKLGHMALAVLEHDFSGFILYEEIDSFISAYGLEGASGATASARISLGIELKKEAEPFVGGETRASDEKDGRGDVG